MPREQRALVKKDSTDHLTWRIAKVQFSHTAFNHVECPNFSSWDSKTSGWVGIDVTSTIEFSKEKKKSMRRILQNTHEFTCTVSRVCTLISL